MKNWREILAGFDRVKVLVVGDVMLDRYFWGTVSRISPEAPVPVVKLEKVTLTAGGAANVAANVSSLGAQAFLVGAVSNDEGGRELPKVLAENQVSAEYLVQFENRPTTTKTRVVAHQQQVVRIDDEHADPLNEAQAAAFWRKIEELLPAADVVILSDYAKGCLCDSVLANTIETARKLNKPVLVDPKGRDYLKYRGATLLTPNKGEASAASRIDITDKVSCQQAGQKLLTDVHLDYLLITLGEDGMQLFEKGKESRNFPAVARKVYDVTGAGDTVIATLAVALGAGADLAAAAQIANAAAGLAVEQVGTAAVKKKELIEQLEEVEPK
jgi:rfaE bifunctional protein kinase chain/domain